MGALQRRLLEPLGGRHHDSWNLHSLPAQLLVLSAGVQREGLSWIRGELENRPSLNVPVP